MSQKFTKQELKSPDAILDVLTHGMSWVQKHKLTLVMIVSSILIVGLLISGIDWYSRRSDRLASEKFYELYKTLQDKKTAFEEAERPLAPDAEGKKSTEIPAAKNKATGNLAQDYGDLPSKIQDFVNSNVGNQAGRTAALLLADLYIKYKNEDEALNVLKLVETKLRPKELISSLLVHQQATLMANKNDCQGALEKWGKIVKNSEVQYLEKEVKFRMGLCYDSLGQQDQAKALLTEISSSNQDNKNNLVSQEANKYLRYLNALKQGS